MTKSDILEKLNMLPPEAQRQVFDFIAFLETRYHPMPKRKPKVKLSDEKFVGIWQKRTDLVNSNAWVRNLRKAEWK
jgi:hypothetical protein